MQVGGVAQALKSVSKKNCWGVGAWECVHSPYRRLAIRIGHGLFSSSPADVFCNSSFQPDLQQFCVCLFTASASRHPGRFHGKLWQKRPRGEPPKHVVPNCKDSGLESCGSLFVRRTLRRNLLWASSALTLDGDRLDILGSFSH